MSVEERKRKHESGLRSAERAAKRLKLESPKTPDKKKMAALLVCHGKVSRSKTPHLAASISPQLVARMSEGKEVPVMCTCKEFAVLAFLLLLPLLVFHGLLVESLISAHLAVID
jgi:hypothetical protein